jgi:hypothetical protein
MNIEAWSLSRFSFNIQAMVETFKNFSSVSKDECWQKNMSIDELGCYSDSLHRVNVIKGPKSSIMYMLC